MLQATWARRRRWTRRRRRRRGTRRRAGLGLSGYRCSAECIRLVSSRPLENLPLALRICKSTKSGDSVPTPCQVWSQLLSSAHSLQSGLSSAHSVANVPVPLTRSPEFELLPRTSHPSLFPLRPALRPCLCVHPVLASLPVLAPPPCHRRSFQVAINRVSRLLSSGLGLVILHLAARLPRSLQCSRQARL